MSWVRRNGRSKLLWKKLRRSRNGIMGKLEGVGGEGESGGRYAVEGGEERIRGREQWKGREECSGN